MDKQQCTVCGAAARVGYTTCDRVCERAEKQGLTRERQQRRDLIFYTRSSRLEEQMLVAERRRRLRALEDFYYNQPYMVVI